MKKILFFLVTCTSIFNVYSQEKLNLEKAVEIALSNNTSIVKSTNNVEATKTNIKTAYGSLLPNLSAGLSWNWQKSTQTNPAYYSEALQQINTSNESRSYSFSAGGNVTLFDGLASYERIDQNENELESAKLSLDRLKQEVILQTTALYYSILNAHDLLKVQEENSIYNQKFLELIKEKKSLGLVPIADVYSQEVQYGNAEMSFIQSKKDYEVAVNQLLEFLSLDVSKKYEFESNIIKPEEMNLVKSGSEDYELMQYYDLAVQKRNDLQSMNYQLLSGHNQLSISKAGLLPSLSGNYSYSTGAGSIGDLFSDNRYGLGLSLNIPIFSNFKTEASIQSAEISVKNSMEDFNALKRQIIGEVKESYIDLNLAKKKLEVSEKTLQSAAENQKVNLELYQVGKGTFLDCLQANKDYVQASTGKITAEYNYYLSIERLYNTVGVR
ncbi:MAG: TolC family protein [bacterium]